MRRLPAGSPGISREEWIAVLEDGARVGLLTGIGSGMYRLHPALPGYLAAVWRTASSDSYEQEREACEAALSSACATFSRWLVGQIDSGNAAPAFALIGMQRQILGAMLGQALDHHKWDDVGAIFEALKRYWENRGLDEESDAWADRIRDATSGTGAPLWTYIVIEQANLAEESGTPRPRRADLP